MDVSERVLTNAEGYSCPEVIRLMGAAPWRSWNRRAELAHLRQHVDVLTTTAAAAPRDVGRGA